MKRKMLGLFLKYLGLLAILPLTPFALAAHHLFRLIEYGAKMAARGCASCEHASVENADACEECEHYEG